MNNAQTFSQDSDQYAKNRPRYPDELFAYLSEISPAHDSAWDCATGNGQAAVSLANHFSRVEATDISAEQLQHHIAHPKVTYRICPAEHTPFADTSFDIVTVATAVHWFDQPKFFQEVDRVLKPKGILAIWSYGFFSISPEIDDLIARELFDPIDRFWAEGNRQMFRGYRDVVLPFEEVPDLPNFSMQLDWNWGQVSAFLRTWSAVKRYEAELGVNPVDRFEPKLSSVWEKPEKPKQAKMPLFLRACRKPA